MFEGGIVLTEVNTASHAEPILVERADRVVTIIFNRPKSMNALDLNLLQNFLHVLKEISLEDDIDIVILKGSGKAFSSGGDIKTMLQGSDLADFNSIMDLISEIAITLYSIPKLTISAIHGAAAGLGLGLALATDYLMADKDAKIAMNFIGIGLIPDGGSHFFLSQKIGEVKAKELIWEGRVLTAEQALKKNLIHKVVEGNLEEALQKQVSKWLQSPTKAMIKTKKIFVERNRPELIKMLELEKYGQSHMRKTEDHQEGIQAFIEKRKPVFKGK